MLKFFVPPKKTTCTEILTQFELLYRDNVMFEIRSEYSDFL